MMYSIFVKFKRTIFHQDLSENKYWNINHFSAIMRQYVCFTSIIDWLNTLCLHWLVFVQTLKQKILKRQQVIKKTFLCKCAKSTRFYVPFYLGVPTKTSKCFYLLLFAHLIESSIILKVGFSQKFAQKHNTENINE